MKHSIRSVHHSSFFRCSIAYTLYICIYILFVLPNPGVFHQQWRQVLTSETRAPPSPGQVHSSLSDSPATCLLVLHAYTWQVNMTTFQKLMQVWQQNNNKFTICTLKNMDYIKRQVSLAKILTTKMFLLLAIAICQITSQTSLLTVIVTVLAQQSLIVNY